MCTCCVLLPMVFRFLVCYRWSCDGAIQDLPRVVVSGDIFLGGQRQALAKKLPRTARFAINRLTVTVSNWTGNSFMAFVDLLEALCKRQIKPSLRISRSTRQIPNGKSMTRRVISSSRGVLQTWLLWKKSAICLKRRIWKKSGRHRLTRRFA